MKKLKLSLFSILMALFLVTSCTNNEPVVQDQQQTEESQSIATSLDRLSLQFDQNGNFTADNNPAGNVVFDFCFDFVYPITLSYNNGTTVEVNGLDDLVNVILNSNDELYINGIAFPFDVETYNEDSDAIEIVTINNEEEFVDLVENCDFDDFEECVCAEIYDPVCVEITDPNGETFTITYPNACYAECDGFTEDDFVDTCEDDYYSNGPECFTLNFPIDIIINGDTVITINSEEELGNALYDVYDFNFVYPFDVTLENEEVVTITNEEDFEDLLEDCFDDYDGNDECEECEDAGDVPVCIEVETGVGTEIIVFPNMCYAICLGYTQDDVVDCEDDNVPNECEDCANEPIDPVCVEFVDDTGVIAVEVFPNACYAECLGYSEEDFVECEDDNVPTDCSEQQIEAAFEECNTWFATVGNSVFTYEFGENDDSLEIYDGSGNLVASGTWEISVDGGSGAVIMILSTNSDNFTTVWFFINCDPSGNFEVITNGGVASDVSPACD